MRRFRLLRLASMMPGCFLAAFAGAQEFAPEPTTGEVIARMSEADRMRAPLLQNYTSLRRYTLENKRLRLRASMTVRLSFRSPGRKEFAVIEQTGSSQIRKRVFRRMLDSEMEASSDDQREATAITPRNYSFRLLGVETLDGRKNYVIDAQPNSANRFLFRGRVWVDAEDFAITRIEGAPAKNPSFWVKKTSFVHRYSKHGPFWMALSNTSETDVHVAGHTVVRIEYSDYRINRETSGGEVTPDQ